LFEVVNILPGKMPKLYIDAEKGTVETMRRKKYGHPRQN